MTVDLTEIARIRQRHQPDAIKNCAECDVPHPCDTATVLHALDEEIGAHIFSTRSRPTENRKRRRARTSRAKRRGR